MLFAKELYFLAFLLPLLNIIFIAKGFKDCTSLHKSILSLALLVILTIIQLGVINIIGDAGDFALTVILTLFLTALPLLSATIFWAIRERF